MNNLENIKYQLEKSILANKSIIITYTNSAGKTDRYLIDTLTSVWQDKLKSVAHSITENKRPSFKAFRLDRIHEIEVTDIEYLPKEDLIEKVQEGTLFDEEDNRMRKKGGIVYPSSISYLSSYKIETKDEIVGKFKNIDIPEKKGWKRAIMYKIIDGDSFEIVIEDEKSKIIQTRLFGVDAPEYKEDGTHESGVENDLGLEAKIFVEDLFKFNRFCYVRPVEDQLTDAYKRYLHEILNAEEVSVGLELLESGLGFPMIGYFTSSNLRKLYIDSTDIAYQNSLGLWSIEEVYDKYNNIMSDSNTTEINILNFIPNKKSAISKYLKQNPKLKILQQVAARRREKERSVMNANIDFKDMTKGINLEEYSLESFKVLCGRYLDIVERIQKKENNINRIFDYLEQIIDMIDEQNLGEGEVKGNFSTSSLKNRLIYHVVGGGLYDKTIPEIVFKNEEDAKYCGFKKSRV